jgi:hypothetical protein
VLQALMSAMLLLALLALLLVLGAQAAHCCWQLHCSQMQSSSRQHS